MDEKIRQIVQEELQKYATDNQYTVNAAPIHFHNNTDSSQIPLSSIIESLSMSAPQGTTSGVFNSNILNGQTINAIPNPAPGNPNPQTPQVFNVLPINFPRVPAPATPSTCKSFCV